MKNFKQEVILLILKIVKIILEILNKLSLLKGWSGCITSR